MRDSLPGTATFTVVHALQPVRRRLGIARLRVWALRGLAVGTLAAIALLALAHVVSLPWEPFPLGIAAMVLGVLAGAVVGAGRWPGSHDAARVADRHFGLQDRLTTALEYHSSTDPFPGLQRDEAGRRVDGLSLEQSGNVPLGRWEAGIPGGLVIAFVALLLVGGTSPGHTRTVVTAGQRQVQRVTVTRVHQITSKAAQSLGPAGRNNPALRKLHLTLERLRQNLEHISTRAAALRAISATQAKLHHLAASLHPVSKSAVAQLNSSLAHSMTAQQRAAAAASDQKALAVAAQTLRKLGAKLSKMTAIQRAHLARSLAQAANATGDSHLQAAIRQAASSLGYNDPQSAAKALQAAASALAQTPAVNSARFRLVQANSQLDSLKNAVSGVSPNSGGPLASSSAANGSPGTSGGTGSGKGGKGQSGGKGGGQGGNGSKGKGSGKGPGSGSGAGGGRGAGNGAQGSGKGSGSGSGAGSRSGQGAPGGHGAGGGRGGAGNTGQGRYTTVYVPFKQGKGPSTTQNGPTGAPQSGPIVPYQQVVSVYGQTAHQALDRANLPPSLRSYVRKYFSTVSH